MIGTLLDEVAAEVGLPADTPVIAVGSHDTASAVVGVPMGESPAAYISSGTWSLVGLELPQPILTEAARLADFTNEAGVDGTVRLLKNVMGLWVLSECVREWGADLPDLLAWAHAEPDLGSVVDVDDPSLLLPGRHAGSPAGAGRGGGGARAVHGGGHGPDGAGQPGVGLSAHDPDCV